MANIPPGGQPAPQSTSERDPVAELKRLSKIAMDMAGMLNSQRTMLAQRGMVVNDDSVDNLRNIGLDLDRVSRGTTDSHVEVQQLRALADITGVINGTQDLNHVLNDVIDTVIELTGAERGYVVLRDVESDELVFRVARNLQQQDLAKDELIVSRTIVQEVAKKGDLVVTTNALEDTRFNISDSVANFQLRSILCVPLKRKGQVIGVIYADNRMKPNVFSEREQRLVYAFANQAAVAIENARLFERVRASLAEITSIKDFMFNVFASIGSGVITTDKNDQIVTLNRAAATILDIPLEESIGKPLLEVLPPLFDGFDEVIAEVRDKNLARELEVDPVLAGRGQVSLALKLSPFKDATQVTQGVAIVLDDRTELKQREARLGVVRRYLPTEMVNRIREIDELEFGGVEREVSILFCDVRGFTTFSEELDPEELMGVINKYLTVSSDAIHRYDGIIDKYMGDAVVGLYNTQLNIQEQHAVHAVMSAMQMVQDVRALHEVLPPEQRLFYGIGVHTGFAVLGNVGSPRRKEFTAIGDSLQFAKLLQENAQGGEVVISKDTYELVKHVVTAEAIEPRKKKDRPDFEVMYLVTGLVQTQ